MKTQNQNLKQSFATSCSRLSEGSYKSKKVRFTDRQLSDKSEDKQHINAMPLKSRHNKQSGQSSRTNIVLSFLVGIVGAICYFYPVIASQSIMVGSLGLALMVASLIMVFYQLMCPSRPSDIQVVDLGYVSSSSDFSSEDKHSDTDANKNHQSKVDTTVEQLVQTSTPY